MSALGQKRTFRHIRLMSALPLKADVAQHRRDVRFVPFSDYLQRSKSRRSSISDKFDSVEKMLVNKVEVTFVDLVVDDAAKTINKRPCFSCCYWICCNTKSNRTKRAAPERHIHFG